MPVALQQQGNAGRWHRRNREIQVGSHAKQGDTGGYPIAMQKEEDKAGIHTTAGRSGGYPYNSREILAGIHTTAGR